MSFSVYFTDKFDVSDVRYAFLFSFENIHGLFRAKDLALNLDASTYYELLSYEVHKSNFVEDAIIDICLAILAGKIEILINDVIGIRINGRLYAYRYIKKLKNLQEYEESFTKIEGFFDEERESYIDRIHDENMVLSVLDGRLFSVSASEFTHNRVFCIEHESFVHKKGPVNSNYSMYGLFDKDIKNINPGNFPFVSLNNAIYFFNKKKRKEKSSMLLYNRKELEMLKDYFQLLDIQFQV